MEQAINSKWIRSDAITEADTATSKPVIAIPAKTYVNKVLFIVTEAFLADTLTIDVGDSLDANGWIHQTDLAGANNPGTFGGTEVTTAAYVNGKYYAAADAITVTLGTGVIDGTGYVLAELLPLGDTMT